MTLMLGKILDHWIKRAILFNQSLHEIVYWLETLSVNGNLPIAVV